MRDWVITIVVSTTVSAIFIKYILFQNNKTSIEHCNVCITGGSAGIGKEIAKQCVCRGAKSVVIVSRNQTKLDVEKNEIEKMNSKFGSNTKIYAYQCDVSKPNDVVNLFSDLRKTLSSIDILICCAGYAIVDTMENITDSEFNQLCATNLLGSMWCVKQAAEDMKKRRSGTICLFASQAAQLGIYGFTAYSASKFGLVGFAQAAMMELDGFNVNVCVAYPADVDTEGFEMENKRKPAITHEICGNSGLWNPRDVAAITLSGIQKGKKRITFGLNGKLLGIATCGFNPPAGIGATLLEIFLAPVVRIIAVFLSVWWRIQIKKTE